MMTASVAQDCDCKPRLRLRLRRLVPVDWYRSDSRHLQHRTPVTPCVFWILDRVVPGVAVATPSARTKMACRRDVAASTRTLSNRSLRSREEIGGGGSSSSTSSAPSSSFALSATWRESRSTHLSASRPLLRFSSRPDRSSVRNSTSYSLASFFLRALPGTPGISGFLFHSSVLRDNQYRLPHRRHTCSLSHSGTLYFPCRRFALTRVSSLESAFSKLDTLTRYVENYLLLQVI